MTKPTDTNVAPTRFLKKPRDAKGPFYAMTEEQSIAKAQQVGFPFERVLSVSPARLLAFLAEHNKPVVQELAPWLAALED